MGFGSGIRDPGSGKNLFRIPDPGVKKAPDPGSGSATLFETIGTVPTLLHFTFYNATFRLQIQVIGRNLFTYISRAGDFVVHRSFYSSFSLQMALCLLKTFAVVGF
jgi:hypothetical protein